MAGSQCCENPPTLIPGYGAGSVTEIGGLKAYVSGPSDSKLSVLLISAIFGYEEPSLRKLADKAAAAGFYVVVPDFFNGDPYVPENVEGHRPLPVWIKSHGTDKGYEDAKPVIAALKSKGISAIGAAGFCWGAKVVVELSKSDHIQAAVILHPSFVTVDDIRESKAPIAVLGAENDHLSPPSLLKQFEEVLSAKTEINSYVKIFPGVSHGWSIRYDTEDESSVRSAEEAQKDMLDWFVEHVK
ncbi:endo-1,3;1,4-beta-D-glucanase-like [Mercurialis annua]|uniref:endo-1,3;1,4-beta-D-glucanase-like n=1 Tax=Mercurialis annua TaxID=3986 RepID=UPI00215F4C66|nr:endo-1,3;1,4-beta-D-glucanase-like [Mercurialis annua]